MNMMRLGLHPGGFAPRLRNLAQVRGFLVPRLARQVARTGDPELSALLEGVCQYGEEAGPVADAPTDIALPIRIEHRGRELCFFSTITTFGAAFDVMLEEIAVEAYFPADEQTARHLRNGVQ
ncbi:transcriptional regulator, XRE family [[Actinomadura] parvosata subsp. kistnae]|nr:transcriptional regulator, XRE family [Actinomadura parvosata subsp. kistnae]